MPLSSQTPDLAAENHAGLVDKRSLPRLIPHLFVGIDEPILEEILACCAVISAADGDAILTPGQENRALYILLSGGLKIYLDDNDTLFIDIQPGECVGEMSLIDSQPVSAYVVAQGPSRLLAIPEEQFWRLLSANPIVARNLLRLLSKRIRIRDQVALQRRHERLVLEKELAIARSIQASMLTTKFDLISRQGIDLFAIMDPVREIGGDFYDAFFITPGKLFVCVGDVVGKGMPAALFMVQSITRLRMEAMRDPSPHCILERVNKGLHENNDSGMFVTLFCGILDTETGELTYANGGHNPPLSDAETGSFEFIPMPDGLIVGFFDSANYESASITLKPGQSLVAYTDGVTEAMSLTGEFFCEERLRIVLNDNIGADARTLTEAIKMEVYAFTGNTHPPDDFTILALRYSSRAKELI
jgi:sigma-B regulation protein RsbU (phosphoserine phosphatase)